MPEYVLMLPQPWEKRGIKQTGKKCSLEKKKRKKFSLKKDALMVSPGHGERQTSLAVPTAVLSVLAMHIKSP